MKFHDKICLACAIRISPAEWDLYGGYCQRCSPKTV